MKVKTESAKTRVYLNNKKIRVKTIRELYNFKVDNEANEIFLFSIP